MFFRALLAFLTLPGMVAGVIPALIMVNDKGRGGSSPFGWIFLGMGIVLLLWCVRDFYVSGKGTLAPWDPPKHLVIVGLYRHVRNPMYWAVLMMIAGWVILSGSRVLAIYLGVVAISVHLRVVLHEEPWLRRTFGDEWTEYAASVRRWWPKIRPEGFVGQ